MRYYSIDYGDSAGNTIAITGNASDGVNAFIVLTPGSGYNQTPIITLSGGGGTGASAGAVTRTLGRISKLNIINAGSGYYTFTFISFHPSTSSSPSP